jgi:hypothetical protein
MQFRVEPRLITLDDPVFGVGLRCLLACGQPARRRFALGPETAKPAALLLEYNPIPIVHAKGPLHIASPKLGDSRSIETRSLSNDTMSSWVPNTGR